MVRAVLWVPFLALLTAVLGLAGILSGLVDREGRTGRRIAGAWGRLLLRAVGVDLVVAGAANAPRGPAVYAVNHGSALDIPILFAGLPADFRIIHKRSLYLVPVVGLYLYATGHIAIDRRNPFQARRSLERAAERIRRGVSVAVFAEGTRSSTEDVQPFKKGSFVLAVNAGVPVVPVSLAGVKRVAAGGLRIRPGAVRLMVHPPVPTEGRTAEDAADLAEEVRRIVAAGCEAA